MLLLSLHLITVIFMDFLLYLKTLVDHQRFFIKKDSTIYEIVEIIDIINQFILYDEIVMLQRL